MIKKKKHFNKPQLRSMIIGAPNETVIAGRGTGKTVGILAPKTSQIYFKTMPRGTGVNVNSTFTQAYSRTLSELIRGWQMLGYQMDDHFIVGTRPTEKWKNKWKWVGPFAPPMDYKHIVSWYNSAIMKIVSMERPGGSNGMSIDWIVGDETKNLNEDRLKTDLLPANRGIIPEFENNPYHHGITFTTDMPPGSAGRWLLDKIKDNDTSVLNQIWELQTCRYILRHTLRKEPKKILKDELQKQIKVIDDELTDLRRGLSYYHEASTLDNIHALGEQYIKNQLRDTSEFQFNTQILNLKPLKMEDAFYPDFDEEHHGYFAENESYFENISIDYLNPLLDCRKDKDRIDTLPMHIALDHNVRIHPIVTAQDNGKAINILSGIHSLYPGKLKEALKMWIDYYKHHKRKLVYYWYDHTSVGGENDEAKWETVTSTLRAAGWVVMPMYIGQTPTHNTRYYLFGDLFKENGPYNKVLRFNRETCGKLIISICRAETEVKTKGFGKNKKSEKDLKFPADESTHYTEALDILIVGMVKKGMKYSNTGAANDRILSSK